MTLQPTGDLTCGGSAVYLMEDCRRLIGNFGCGSVVSQHRNAP